MKLSLRSGSMARRWRVARRALGLQQEIRKLNGRDSPSSQSHVLTIAKTPQRTLRHLQTFGKIAGIAIITTVLYLIFDKENGVIGHYEFCVRWFTLIFGALAIWLLIRDWFVSGNMTFVFDGDQEVFSVKDKNRELSQLTFGAIKRIKIEESSNLFPLYILSVHLQDGQIIEIDASANQAEINSLANQISEMTGVRIVMQHYDEPLSKEEKEDQRMQRNQVYRGD
jgi:hypothetical protein